MAKGFNIQNILNRPYNGQLLSGIPLIEMLGTNRVLIENHRGISAYSLSEVVVRVAYGQIKIQGEGLTLSMMSREQLVISGAIDSVGLIRGKDS